MTPVEGERTTRPLRCLDTDVDTFHYDLKYKNGKNNLNCVLRSYKFIKFYLKPFSLPQIQYIK